MCFFLCYFNSDECPYFLSPSFNSIQFLCPSPSSWHSGCVIWHSGTVSRYILYVFWSCHWPLLWPSTSVKADAPLLCKIIWTVMILSVKAVQLVILWQHTDINTNTQQQQQQHYQQKNANTTTPQHHTQNTTQSHHTTPDKTKPHNTTQHHTPQHDTTHTHTQRACTTLHIITRNYHSRSVVR